MQKIRELIKKADPDIIKNIIIDFNFYEIVKNYGFSIDINADDIEYRRLELLHYLDEIKEELSKINVENRIILYQKMR